MNESATPEKPKKYDEYEVRSAMDTLIRAEEIRADEKLMGLVNKELSKKKRAINSIADLKAKASEMDKKVDQPVDEKKSIPVHITNADDDEPEMLHPMKG